MKIIYGKTVSVLIFFGSFALEPHLAMPKGLFLTVHSGITSDNVVVPYKILGIESRSAECKSNALTAVLSLHPYFYF